MFRRLRRKSVETKHTREFDTVHELISSEKLCNQKQRRFSTMNDLLFRSRDRDSLEFLQDWKKQQNIQNQKVKLIQLYRNQVKVNAKKKDELSCKKVAISFIIMYCCIH